MQIEYLEIVTKDVDAVCTAYPAVGKEPFGEPIATLGNARSISLPGGRVSRRPGAHARG